MEPITDNLDVKYQVSSRKERRNKKLFGKMAKGRTIFQEIKELDERARD